MRNWLTQAVENEGVEGMDTRRGVMYPFRRNRLFSTEPPAAALPAQRQLVDSKRAAIALAEVRHTIRPVLDAGSSR